MWSECEIPTHSMWSIEISEIITDTTCYLDILKTFMKPIIIRMKGGCGQIRTLKDIHIKILDIKGTIGKFMIKKGVYGTQNQGYCRSFTSIRKNCLPLDQG